MKHNYWTIRPSVTHKQIVRFKKTAYLVPLTQGPSPVPKMTFGFLTRSGNCLALELNGVHVDHISLVLYVTLSLLYFILLSPGQNLFLYFHFPGHSFGFVIFSFFFVFFLFFFYFFSDHTKGFFYQIRQKLQTTAISSTSKKM